MTDTKKFPLIGGGWVEEAYKDSDEYVTAAEDGATIRHLAKEENFLVASAMKAIQLARDSGIEISAIECEKQTAQPECPERAQYCADAIRALKTAPSPIKAEPARCPACFGAGIYMKALVFPAPPDVTCMRCNGSGRDYATPSLPPQEKHKVDDVIIHAIASLAAAISLLEKSSKTAAPSNKMFDQMLADYRKSLDAARTYITSKQGQQPEPIGMGPGGRPIYWQQAKAVAGAEAGEAHEKIDWSEISKRGLLMRINREIMHPIGLAVYRDEKGNSGGALVSKDGKWEYPEDAAQALPVADTASADARDAGRYRWLRDSALMAMHKYPGVALDEAVDAGLAALQQTQGSGNS